MCMLKDYYFFLKIDDLALFNIYCEWDKFPLPFNENCLLHPVPITTVNLPTTAGRTVACCNEVHLASP